MSTDIIHGY